jgi:hypothetical protein
MTFIVGSEIRFLARPILQDWRLLRNVVIGERSTPQTRRLGVLDRKGTPVGLFLAPAGGRVAV